MGDWGYVLGTYAVAFGAMGVYATWLVRRSRRAGDDLVDPTEATWQ